MDLASPKFSQMEAAFIIEMEREEIAFLQKLRKTSRTISAEEIMV